MANRSLAAKAEKAKRQRRGVDVAAPRWSENAGQFRATESLKACYLRGMSKDDARALIAATCTGRSATVIEAGERLVAIGKGQREATRRCYGDGRRREAVLDASCYATGDLIVVRTW